MYAKLIKLSGLLILISLLLASCAPKVVEKTVEVEKIVKETIEVEKQVEVEKVVEKTVVQEKEVIKEVEVVKEITPTAEPVARKGAWVDEMVFTSIDEAPNAVAQLQANAIDYYAYQVEDADVFKTVKDDPNLAYSVAYGSFDSLLFNPSGPTFQDGRLNPFSNQKIREAVNWMLDRDYLVQETVGGLGIPKWVVLIQAYPDYPRFADIIRPIEAKYAFNMAKADEVLTAEMTAMGATKVDGKWQFNGSPVVIIGLIRSEDEREEIGNYFADRLEELGFTVDRQVRTRSELSPIWQQSDPTEGQWHYYTAGNGYPVVVRNAGYFFDEFYMPRGDTTTTSQAYAPTAEFDEVALKLSTNDYTSLEERSELFKRALSLSLENSQYVFNIGTYSFYPRKANLIVSSDLGGGANMSALYPYTIRWEGQEGGTVRIAQSGILFGPWNAIAGNNWVQDLMMVQATYDDAVLSDPFTGLFWPQRLQRAEVVAQEGLPMTKTLDWIDLKFAPEIKVPSDAWVDWDAKNQKFITAAEKFPEGLTARTKTTVYYPPELWDIKWHDGSKLSIGDFVMYMIQIFDQGKVDSPIYDETQASAVDAFLTHFKGVRILSTKPLIIETYEDLSELDAEWMLAYAYIKWFPVLQTGELAWHSFVPGMLAEMNRELAFSANKSTELNVDWTNYIDGPSLEILKKYLDQAAADTYIPYAPTLGQYIDNAEAAERYANLLKWYEQRGHFWVGTGPFYLDSVHSVEGVVVLKRNPDFPDPANKWDRFGEPMLATVDAMGPADITAGAEASFDVFVSFKDQPYPQADIEAVIYLLYNAAGEVVGKGEAEAVSDGQYLITLSAEATKSLPTGAGKLEIIVVPKPVSVPGFALVQFMVK